MKKIIALSILIFSVAFTACSGDGNPAARISDGDINTPDAINNPSTVITEMADESKKSTSEPDYDYDYDYEY